MTLQAIEGLDLSADCWLHIHLSAVSLGQRVDSSSGPQPLLAFYKSEATEIPHDAGLTPIPYPGKNFSPQRI